MNVLVLMAGDGKRFTNVGITTPKPLIEVNDKPILEWTTRSLPFIKHADDVDKSLSIDSSNLYFAIRQEHENDGVCNYLTRVYGDNINFIVFQKTTRGNMETAYVSTLSMPPDEPLLILDADNKYNDCDFLNTLDDASDFPDSMVVTYFDPIDKDPKWAFVFTDGALVKRIVEKDPKALEEGGSPLVGTFWFKTTALFQRYADQLIQTNTRSGITGREEFYVSQVPSAHIKNGGIVFAHKVSDVVPLGTPEDVEKFKQ
jgi:NDP-sugar pyrophosphorylase family protein